MMEQFNVENDILNLDVPELIRSKQYFQYISIIKNYEDTLQKILASKSTVDDSADLFVWNMSDPKNANLFPKLGTIDLQPFDMEIGESLNNVVICGPYIRSCLVKNLGEYTKYAELRKELYLYKIGDEMKWSDLTQLENFQDKKTEYLFDDGERKISLMRKSYKSLSHVILQNDYLKRCGWFNGCFYVSSMFLIEIQKHITLLAKNFKDPILNHPYDPLEIYQITNKDNTHPVKIIDSLDYEELVKTNKKNITKLFNSKTCIEMCIDKIASESKIILLNHLRQMICFLSCDNSIVYKRPPFLYAKILSIDKTMYDVYETIKNVKLEYQIDYENIKNVTSIEDINMQMIKEFIKLDNPEYFFDFLVYTKKKICSTIINNIVEFNALNITKQIIVDELVDINMQYYLILMTENLNSIKLFKSKFDMDIAFNYLKDILENGKLKSFYWLYEHDKSIINTIYEDGNNILHLIKPKCNYKDLIKLILKLKPEIININNNAKETPIVYHAKYNHNMFEVFLDYDFNPISRDKEGNMFLHYLAKSSSPETLKKYLKKYPEIINMPNTLSETPAIVACKYNNEDNFYVLKSNSASLDATDYYGNTVYHYICANSMCIGMLIENKKNHFSLAPSDYCKIAQSFYGFC